jgi:hypothetical protein
MERRRAEAEDREWKAVLRGWCLGEKAFRKELPARMAEEKAERIVAGELRKLKWKETDLETHRKGDLGKVRIARRLRQETTVTLKWIAQRLRMGKLGARGQSDFPLEKVNCVNTWD